MTRTSAVLNPRDGRYEMRPWAHPLAVACCPHCSFEAIAVNADRADICLFEHAVAVHLPIKDLWTQT